MFLLLSEQTLLNLPFACWKWQRSKLSLGPNLTLFCHNNQTCTDTAVSPQEVKPCPHSSLSIQLLWLMGQTSPHLTVSFCLWIYNVGRALQVQLSSAPCGLSWGHSCAHSPPGGDADFGQLSSWNSGWNTSLWPHCTVLASSQHGSGSQGDSHLEVLCLFNLASASRKRGCHRFHSLRPSQRPANFCGRENQLQLYIGHLKVLEAYETRSISLLLSGKWDHPSSVGQGNAPCAFASSHIQKQAKHFFWWFDFYLQFFFSMDKSFFLMLINLCCYLPPKI